MDSDADHFCKTEISTEPPKAEAFSRPWKSSDLVIKVASRKFHVHRAVLIICSPVFEAMLSSNFKEKFAPERPLPGKGNREAASRYLSWSGSIYLKGKLSRPDEAFDWIPNRSTENPLWGILKILVHNRHDRRRVKPWKWRSSARDILLKNG